MKAVKDILKANKDRKIIILPVGVSGSGKTFFYRELSKEFDIGYISFDRIRIQEFLKNKKIKKKDRDIYREAYRFVNENRIKLLPIAKRQLKNSNKNIIYIDNTNLTKKARNKFLCEADGYIKIGIFFKTDIDTCIKRQFLSSRDKFVSPKIIKEQFSVLQEPTFDEFDIIARYEGNHR